MVWLLTSVMLNAELLRYELVVHTCRLELVKKLPWIVMRSPPLHSAVELPMLRTQPDTLSMTGAD